MTEVWWGWSTAQRRWVHFYRVSAQNQLPFRSKGKRENARCLSHWANDCSLADAALHSGLSPPFFLGKKPPRWCSNEQYGQREWQRVHSWGHLPQGSSRSHKTFDVCSPPHHWPECAGKENTAVWGLCFPPFLNQTRMGAVCIRFTLPRRIVLTKCTLAMKDYIRLLYSPGNRRSTK